MTIRTPDESRTHLIDSLNNEIIPNLRMHRNDHVYPFHFVKLDSGTVSRMVIELKTETDRFGKIINDMRKEFYHVRKEKELIEILWSIFWWPAVHKIWPLQCFEVNTDEELINDLYLLARTGPDEWIGVQTKVNYTPEG